MSGESEEASEEGIRVFVRIRPLNRREIEEKQTIGWDFNSTSMLEDTQNGQRVYAFDRCYSPEENNKDVYELVGKPVILKAMEGYNGTVFTYGQTGSGKTYTMRGCDDDPGMMILCINDIFGFIEAHKHKAKFTLKIAYMEVYNEEINDLLGEGMGSKNLRIVSEDSIKGAVIGNLTEVEVDSPVKMLEVLRKGETSRSYGSTTMNAESSRSHTIYRISIESVEIDMDDAASETSMRGLKNEVVGITRLSFMNLVDLAGSERQKSTGASGKTLKEGANINKSLLALGAVINKLGEASKKAKGAKPVFLPYRDSKLTRILKQSLGGNTMTSILCTVTPAPMHREETVSTLKFGQLCKTIKNTVKSNEVIDDRMLIKQYKATIQELRMQVNHLEEEAAEKSNGVDHVLVQTLQQEKKDLESKVKSLEVLVMRGDSAAEEVKMISSEELNEANEALKASQSQCAALQEELNLSKKKIRQLNTEIINLEHNQASLESDLGALNDFEELKNTFEEYQQQVQAQIDDDRTKMEAEKEMLQSERSLTMAERTHLDEKEGRLGLLLAALDERESKLRHHLNTLKEQEGHWQQSIEDLTRREELVEEWQSNHRSREKKLQDWDDQLEKKFSELSERESRLVESEHKFKVQQRELGEREQRLQVALSRVAHTEQAVSSQEEKLSAQENALKVRENEMEVKEREVVVRRRELEQWDSLIREKDRKVGVEQRHLEEREEEIQAQEDRVRSKENELDNSLLDVRQKEADVKIMKEKYSTQLMDLETRESMLADQTKRANDQSSSLSIKEAQLKAKEVELKELEVKFKDTNARTEELNRRVAEHEKAVDKFFNHDVAQITARHAKELNDLEELIEQQLQSVANYQRELEKVKQTNSSLNKEKDELEGELTCKASTIAEMEKELSRLEEEREMVKREAEEERRAAKLQERQEGVARPEGSGDGSGAETNGSTSYPKVANRSFLVQLAETQAMLKAVLKAQTAFPSTSYLGKELRASENDHNLLTASSLTAERPRRLSGGSDATGRGYTSSELGDTQPSLDDASLSAYIAHDSRRVGAPVDPSLQGSELNRQAPHHMYSTPETDHRADAASSYREFKSDESRTTTPPSRDKSSESGMKRLVSSPRTSSSRRLTSSAPNRSKFEVLPKTSSGNFSSSPRSAHTPRGGIYTTSSANASGSSTASHGNTPVVSVELSLNRSGNRSKTSSARRFASP